MILRENPPKFERKPPPTRVVRFYSMTARGQQVAGSGQRGSGVILPKGLAVPYGAAIRAPGR